MSLSFKLVLTCAGILYLTSACRSQYALLHDRGYQGYSAPMKKTFFEPAKEISLPEAQLSTSAIVLKAEIAPVKKVLPKIKVSKTPIIFPDYKEFTSVGPEPKTKAKPKKKPLKKNKNWRKMGSNLVIGFVFLGIAVGLSLLHLGALAILFGLASIIFLILGIKKAFRLKRKRIINPFKK